MTLLYSRAITGTGEKKVSVTTYPNCGDFPFLKLVNSFLCTCNVFFTFFFQKTYTLIMYFYLIQLCFPNFHCVFNIQVCFAVFFSKGAVLIFTFKWEKISWSVLKPNRIENFIMQVYFFNAFLSRLWEYI